MSVINDVQKAFNGSGSVRAGGSRKCRLPLAFALCEQAVARFIEPLDRATRVIQMTNQFSGRPVDVDPFEIIQFRTTTVENFSTHHNADVNTIAVEYIAVHRGFLP